MSDPRPLPARSPQDPGASRRRVGLVVAAVIAALVIVVLATPGTRTVPAPDAAASDASDGSARAAPVEVVVGPGETLWDVAVEHAPAGSDPRAYLAALREHNAVGPALPAWTVIELPPHPADR